MTLTTTQVVIGSSLTTIYTAGAGTTQAYVRLINKASDKAYLFSITPSATAPNYSAAVTGGLMYPLGGTIPSGDLFAANMANGDVLSGITEGGYAVATLLIVNLP